MQNWNAYIYYTVNWAHFKSFKSLPSGSGSGDTSYPQKQGKFTTFEVHFDLYGCFVYIVMLKIFKKIVGNVSEIYGKQIKTEDLRLWGRYMWGTRIYWRCVQFTVKWAWSHAFQSTISRSPTSTLATNVILFLNQIYNTKYLVREEFVNLSAIINILLSKQYISILKNHCLANNRTDAQL